MDKRLYFKEQRLTMRAADLGYAPRLWHVPSFEAQLVVLMKKLTVSLAFWIESF
jgi:hypothetical protein